MSVTWGGGTRNGIKAYTGREWDPETGLYYYRARYYDPKVGRFISEDPIGFAGGVNFYGYVWGRPTGLVDPFGLDVWIEGPSHFEPPGHQSVAVGNPMTGYFSVSWGLTRFSPYGHVYRDIDGPGPFGSYAKTTPEQDAAIVQELLGDLNWDRRSGLYGIAGTCRTYSQDRFNEFVNKFKLQLTPPPIREPAPNLRPWWFSSPTTGATSSTTSSSGTSTSR
jgi:RHS repeat-associated protein